MGTLKRNSEKRWILRKNGSCHFHSEEKILRNWNGYPKHRCLVSEPYSASDKLDRIPPGSTVIARGNGKSYGDASLGNCVISTLGNNKILAFSAATRSIHCESGTLISSILEKILPHNLFLPVVPGTKFITLGGAIASDVHGKNHCTQGSISKHVKEITLLTSDNETVTCTPKINPDLFWNTFGGKAKALVLGNDFIPWNLSRFIIKDSF